MVLYNVTVSIDNQIHEDWLAWMKSKHVPDVMDTGCFVEARILRVHGEEDGGKTFAISYLCKTEEVYAEYQQKHAPALQKEHADKFGGKFAAFRTQLTVLEEFKA